MVRRRKPPSVTWRAFLKNHISDIVATDFFVLSTGRNQVLFVFLVLAHERRCVLHFNVTTSPTTEWTTQQIVIAPRSPWQNPFVERLIASIRRECLDHTIVLNERHLKRILADYFRYYHRWRTHPALEMDSPGGREVHSADRGRVAEVATARLSRSRLDRPAMPEPRLWRSESRRRRQPTMPSDQLAASPVLKKCISSPLAPARARGRDSWDGQAPALQAVGPVPDREGARHRDVHVDVVLADRGPVGNIGHHDVRDHTDDRIRQ